jgi:citrate synthase
LSELNKEERPELSKIMLRGSSGVVLLGRQVVVHGKDVHHECLDETFVGYTLLSATGRTFPKEQARVFEEYWIATGYADPRIWCNRIAGYLGSARVDPGLSLSAAIAACESLGYGFGAMRAAYRIQAQIPDDEGARNAWLESQLGNKTVLHGYGRPVYGRDERIAAALRTLHRQGLNAGPALKRAFWLDRELRKRKDIAMNISGVWAATSIDFGLTELEYAAFFLLMLSPGYMAVYADQRKREPMSFLPEHHSEPQV